MCDGATAPLQKDEITWNATYEHYVRWEKCNWHSSCKGYIGTCLGCENDDSMRVHCARAQGCHCKGPKIYCFKCSSSYDLIPQRQADNHLGCDGREGHLVVLRDLHQQRALRSQSLSLPDQGGSSSSASPPPREPGMHEEIVKLRARAEQHDAQIQHLRFTIGQLIAILGTMGVDITKFQ